MYEWNKYQTDDIRACLGDASACLWSLPLIHGSFQQVGAAPPANLRVSICLSLCMSVHTHSLWSRVDEMLDGWMDGCIPTYDTIDASVILILMRFYGRQRRFSLFGRVLDMVLIARRSRHYAGTRCTPRLCLLLRRW